MVKNPVVWSDFPDLDPIRVGDTYYMVSTTMYLMPGCVILRSYDLMNWEIASYVCDRLDDTPRQCLDGGHAYGQGMWAASLRYHKGKFYVVFVCWDENMTYLYTADKIEGPWEKSHIEGFYHDCSLFFDDDDRVYLVYGVADIHLTELKPDLSGPLPGGRDRIIVSDKKPFRLGYEGSHFYKINGRYYLFNIHMPGEFPKPDPNAKPGEFKMPDGFVSRTNACHWSDDLDGEFVSGEIFADDMGYRHSGVAQGGIVDTPDGDWYMTLFQDHGAIGRVPVIVPFHWENGFPVCGDENGKTPLELNIPSTRPDYVYKPMVGDDDFNYKPGEPVKDYWEWNHTPVPELYSFTDRPGAYRITTGRLDPNVHFAKNTLTMRTFGPWSQADVTIDGSGMKDGDIAGLGTLLSAYGIIALSRDNGKYALKILNKDPQPMRRGGGGIDRSSINDDPAEVLAEIECGETVRVRAYCHFDDGTGDRGENEYALYYYEDNGEWKPLGGKKKLRYGLDYFVGTRFGLLMYSTKEFGGHADFIDFKYDRG